MRKLLRFICVVPAVALFACLSFYVATGIDLLPGDVGSRWFALVMLAIFGIVGFGASFLDL